MIYERKLSREKKETRNKKKGKGNKINIESKVRRKVKMELLKIYFCRVWLYYLFLVIKKIF